MIFPGMGTKIQANGFLREYHSMINLNDSGMRPVNRENWAGENGIHPGSLMPSGLGCDMEKARRTILEQELTFRNQLQELHHLYERQKELMDEIKRRETHKAVANQGKSLQPSFLASGDSKKAWNAPHPSALQFPTFLEGKVVPKFAPRILSICEPRLFKSSVCLKGPCDIGIQADVPNIDDKVMHRLLKFSSVDTDATRLSLGAVQAFDLCNGSRKEYSSDGCTEKSKFDRCNSVGGSCSGKLSAFPHPLVDELNKGLTQRTRKLFGVELEGCNGNNPLDASSSLEQTVGSSSWIDKSFAQNLSLSRMDSNGKAETLKAGKSSCPSETTGNWLQRCSADVLRTDSEHSEKFRCSVPPSQTAHPDCRNGMGSSLPWFLRNKQDRCNFSKGATLTPYFMNLDSLQSCSQNFFRKTQTADGAASEAVQQNKENLAEGDADELNRSTGASKIIGFPIPDMIHTSACDVDYQDSQKDENSNLRHGIDLNLSLSEEALRSVSCSATEINMEAPAVTEFESYDDKTAAEALLSIASRRINSVHGSACKPANSCCLKWFAEIVSSQRCKSMHNCIDHFEYMTLHLEESKEEHYHGHEPYVWSNNQTENKAVDEKRFRRGMSRRGRLRKDFQRDILPGMTSLSRLEVAEDFQAFVELMKPIGGIRRPSSGKNGRGRKRKPICQLEDGSLTGWGKRIRRLPRQRCASAFLSFAVKC